MYAYRLIKQMLGKYVKASGEGGERRFVLVCDVKGSDGIRALEAAGCVVRTYGREIFNSIRVKLYERFVSIPRGEAELA